ncbi:hypothetical protein PR048_007301 [Dryococelus australis]|uniref:Uncharacterized protein n=1 Tax=Dryococelus australis TaxID=614101 RepID=A0ABQ9IDT4_9NEOP|nr:hypothetical protein PR048_007301 [Dryococelus australis]
MEVNLDDFQSLIIENYSRTRSLDFIIPGRRIVNPSYLLPQLEAIRKQPLSCIGGCLQLHSEKRKGLHLKYEYYCEVCEEIHLGHINLSSGLGYSQMQEVIGVMDLPIMTSSSFRQQ